MAKYNSKFTQERCCKIYKALEKGHSVKGACGLAGIGESTYYDWYDRGLKAKSGKYKEFADGVDKAKAKAISTVEDVIIDAIPQDISTAKWWLIKHAPDIYVDRQETRTQLEGKVETEVTVNLLDKVKQKRRELNDSNSK